jgi:type I pantothenate kinase
MLQQRGLMGRKGFPESYDLRRMIRFLADVKAGKSKVSAPVYSHQAYDIVRGERQTVTRPDIVIFEGLNVLQAGSGASQRMAPVIVSDFFDFSVYVDADEADIEAWYVERFLLLQRTAFQQPTSFFHHYKDLPLDEAQAVARQIWRDINGFNLSQNILPTRERAQLILRKGPDHAVREVWLRQT